MDAQVKEGLFAIWPVKHSTKTADATLDEFCFFRAIMLRFCFWLCFYFC